MYSAWWQTTSRGFDERAAILYFGEAKGGSLWSVGHSRGVKRALWLVFFPVARTESSFVRERCPIKSIYSIFKNRAVSNTDEPAMVLC
jgi:hypothetical protein